MNEYELLYIVHPRKAADDVPAVIDWVGGLVQQAGGVVQTVDNWGRRRLAYPIDHQLDGTYVLTTAQLPPESTRSIESQLLISDDIMRHVLIRGIIPFESREERGRDRDREPERESRTPAEQPVDEQPAEVEPVEGEEAELASEPSPAATSTE